jgi:hypothetical protein
MPTTTRKEVTNYGAGDRRSRRPHNGSPLTDILLRACQGGVQTLTLVIVEVIPGVGGDQLDLGTFREIRRFVHDQATAPHVPLQANHGAKDIVAVGFPTRR